MNYLLLSICGNPLTFLLLEDYIKHESQSYDKKVVYRIKNELCELSKQIKKHMMIIHVFQNSTANRHWSSLLAVLYSHHQCQRLTGSSTQLLLNTTQIHSFAYMHKL